MERPATRQKAMFADARTEPASKAGETLRGYIRRFSRQCNELPNVADTDVIGAFLSGTTYESLVHKLGRKGPRTTKELMDIATSHAQEKRQSERSSIALTVR